MFAEPNADTAENIVKLTETNKKKTQQTGIFVKLVDFSFQICIFLFSINPGYMRFVSLKEL